MIVAVVEIGKVHVGVNQGRVIVRMSMRPVQISFMFVSMVFVVVMPVLVPDFRMLMFVRVVLAKKKYGGTDHDESGHGQSWRQRLSQEKEGNSCSEKWGCLKPCRGSGCADIAQGIYEEDETRPVTECAEKEGKQDERRVRQPIPDPVRDKKGDQPGDETLELGYGEGVSVR